MSRSEATSRALASLTVNRTQAAKNARIAYQRSRNVSEKNRVAENVPVYGILATPRPSGFRLRRHRPSVKRLPWLRQDGSVPAGSGGVLENDQRTTQRVIGAVFFGTRARESANHILLFEGRREPREPGSRAAKPR